MSRRSFGIGFIEMAEDATRTVYELRESMAAIVSADENNGISW
jgi:hypothetical protein